MATNTLDRLHCDLVGPITTRNGGSNIRVLSLTGKKYALVTVNEKSRFVLMQALEFKSDAAAQVIAQCNLLRTQCGKPVKEFHSDNGTEFVNGTLAQYCNDTGMVHTTTTAYTPAHNGIAERTHAVLFGMARAMLHASGAPATLWAAALSAAVYVHNRTERKALNGKSPFEVLYGKVADKSKVRTWGCDACHSAQSPAKQVECSHMDWYVNWLQ